MADPITVDHYRAMLILKGKSGLAEDVYVNSWVFRNDGIGETRQTVHDRIVAAIDDFIGLPAISGEKIGKYLPLGMFSGAEIRTYDLGEPPGDKAAGVPPRTPLTTLVPSTATRWGLTDGAPLPQEVAACISWRTGLNNARGRGRTYVGPLKVLAVDIAATSGGHVRLSSTFQDALLRSATRLMERPNLSLVVLGLNGPQEVTGGYVDDAFDTQRRRGTKASARQTFPVVL